MDQTNVEGKTPHPTQERIVAIDILRGFALFGVLVANALAFSYPFQVYAPLSFPELDLDEVGRMTEWLVRLFVVGSFYPLFSFLFGLGFSLYLRKGDEALPLFRRRLAILLLIGLIHAVFIWSGDILVTYALIGFLLIAFRRQSDKALLVWMTVLTAWTFATVWLLGSSENGLPLSYIEQATRAYGAGSYPGATRQRLTDTGLTLLNLPVAGPQILAFFLGGLLLGRQTYLEDTVKHHFWQRVCLVSFLVGVPIVGLHAFLVLRPDPVPSFLSALDLTLGSPALGFGYLAGLALCLTPSVQRRLRSLAAVGRMALTNYLMQSVIFTLIFCGYGGGLYGEVNPLWGVMLAFVIFPLQMMLSHWWLRRFRYGPVEWGWRCLTYGRWLTTGTKAR